MTAAGRDRAAPVSGVGTGDRAPGRVEELLLRARRIAVGPALVRAGLLLAGLLAQFVAWPTEIVFAWPVLVLLAIAAAPVVAPHTRLVTAAVLAAVVGWLAATTAYGEPVAYWRLVLLAASLYAVHVLAALAAVLPYDAAVEPVVVAGWLGRAGVVALLTVAVAMFTLLVPAYLGGHRYLVASLFGLAVMVGLAGYLAALVRRR
jgi:hypothetical protein